jgi:molybdate transport system ATP-binding protein
VAGFSLENVNVMVMMASEPLFFLDKATAVRSSGEVALRDLSWTVCEGETWAVVGPVASGKTSLASALLGRCRIDKGAIGWPLLERLRTAGAAIAWPSQAIHYVGFKEKSWLFSYGRHYYQQRFNFIEPRDDVTLEAFLRAGTSANVDDLARVARQMGIDTLRPLSLIKLSNGQIRRARIARALLSKPEWLILDEPFMGLDRAGRDEVESILGGLVRQGTRLLLITRADSIPEWVTHVLELDRLTVHWQGRRAEFVARLPREIEQWLPVPSAVQSSTAEPIIEMHHVNVRYGDLPILRDVSWTVRTGERWAVLGPNGSGKTTLLSLICADHPQAYSNNIRLFGRQRGTGESIWEIKRHIGLVSPELHLYFSEPLSAAQTAATGFFDVVTHRPTTPEQDRKVFYLFEQLGITALAKRSFASLSTGEQRLVLLIRAFVKDPPLLVLDEPFQGLDEHFMRKGRHWLDFQLRPEQTMIFVTHQRQEIPQTVHGFLHLDSGQVVEDDS